MAHCIRTFTDEVSEYSRKLVGIVQQIEGGEQIVEDGVGMAHTEHVRWDLFTVTHTHNCAFLLTLILILLIFMRSPAQPRVHVLVYELISQTSMRLCVGRRRWR